jgi:hypothetical protein
VEPGDDNAVATGLSMPPPPGAGGAGCANPKQISDAVADIDGQPVQSLSSELHIS